MINVYNKNPYNLSVTKKICLSGIFIVLVILFNKVFAINYIAFIPFVRLSFGSIALIVFSSIFFGPIYGLFVGVFADIIGYFLFDMSSFAWFPQITLTYALLGFVPYFIYRFISIFKSKKMMAAIEYGIFALIFIGITLFFALNNEISLYGKMYSFEVWQRILIPSIALLLCLITIVTNILIDKKFSDENMPLDIYHLSFIMFLCEIAINFLFGSLMKSWAFGFNMFGAILISQAILMFFNIPYNCYLIFVIMKLSKKYWVN